MAEDGRRRQDQDRLAKSDAPHSFNPFLD
jgi:hypothetical protein